MTAHLHTHPKRTAPHFAAALSTVLQTTLLAALLVSLLVSPLPVKAADASSYDATLAQKTGADERGMRKYVLVILKTGPNPVPKGPDRDEMFKGHFANMGRLAEMGVLAVAGPLDGVDGWRGLFILAVDSIDEAKKHVATDPVIMKGEMIAEYHTHYGSAALMMVNELHKKLAKNPM